MSQWNRFEVFTRTYGLHHQDALPLLTTNDAAAALHACRAAMKREEGTAQATHIRDLVTGREYGGLDVFQFANEFGIVIPD